jgi:lysophospholipase L1-like esterase
MPVVLVILALLAVLLGGAVALFTIGTIGAVVLVLLVLGVAGYGLYARGSMLSIAVGVSALVAVVAIGFGGFNAYQLYAALGNFDGESDAPDAAALASAEAKLDAAREQAGFRVELTAEELTAIFQDTLADAEDNPIRRVDLVVVDGHEDEQGVLEFVVTFKNGSLTGEGRVGATLEAGAISLQVEKVSLGNLSLPGIATGAMEDLVETVLDLNDRLDEVGADIQAIDIGDGRVLVTGTQGDGEILTAASLLDALAENAAAISSATTPPVEVIGPGDVNGNTAEGPSYVVALGDSLAASLGVIAPNLGYVSRFHSVVAERDGIAYGLRNYGVSGETSGTLIRSGQLDEALDFIRDNEVAYVTIDIGANDLLGHLGSEDCSEDIEDPACQDRLAPALEAYRANLDRILGDLRDAAGDATPIYFLATYNPFSLGLGLSLEAASNDATDQLNQVAADVAAEYEVVVADGATPLRGTASVTTHMLDTPPDIHPNSAGHDLLAQALVGVLP